MTPNSRCAKCGAELYQGHDCPQSRSLYLDAGQLRWWNSYPPEDAPTMRELANATPEIPVYDLP